MFTPPSRRQPLGMRIQQPGLRGSNGSARLSHGRCTAHTRRCSAQRRHGWRYEALYQPGTAGRSGGRCWHTPQERHLHHRQWATVLHHGLHAARSTSRRRPLLQYEPASMPRGDVGTGAAREVACSSLAAPSCCSLASSRSSRGSMLALPVDARGCDVPVRLGSGARVRGVGAQRVRQLGVLTRTGRKHKASGGGSHRYTTGRGRKIQEMYHE